MHSAQNLSHALLTTKSRSLARKKGTTPLKMNPLCIVFSSFCFSDAFSASELCFQMPLLICFIMSWKTLFVPNSTFNFCLGHQCTLSEVDVFDYEAHPIVVGFIFFEIHSAQGISMGIGSPGMYFNSKSKTFRPIAHLVILAHAVFGISSSGANRYLSGLWSVCRVNSLQRKNCCNLVTKNKMASASRCMFE